MLLNLSYNDPAVRAKLTEQVGKPYTLKERVRLKGIGSARFKIINASPNIQNLLVLDNNANLCNLELRPKGLLIHFKKLLDAYALVVPFYKLSLYKTDNGYSIHKEEYFMTIQSQDTEGLKKFMDKVIACKALYLTDKPDF